jgi:hypothetical protein
MGGVLVFGSYDDTADNELRATLRRRLSEEEGIFPRDLHFSRSNLAPYRKAAFLAHLGADLPGWCGTERELAGVYLVGSPVGLGPDHGILSERHADYRYQSMLWTLVEHLVFVDPEVRDRLDADFRLHLHVASRSYVFDPDIESREYVESLGYRVQEHQQSGKLRIDFMLQPRDLLQMLRMALRQRWPHVSLTPEIEVERIDYVGGRSPAGLYLADLYLGQARNAEQARHGRGRHSRPAELLPTWKRLEQGPWLELLARQQSALAAGDAAGYLAAAGDWDVVGEDLLPYEPIVVRQEQAAAGLLAPAPGPLFAALEEACWLVGQPGEAGTGLRRADRAIRLLRSFSQPPVRAEVLALQAQLSAANHVGEIDLANHIWELYLRREPELATLGLEGLRLRAEMRNRRAVNLTDRFRHAEAEEVLAGVIAGQEAVQSLLAATVGLASTVPQRELGACLGTLGQIRCFADTSGGLEAEAAFRRACEFFTAAADVDRQWVYLGHLACDWCAAGRPLWDQVCGHFPELGGVAPVAGSDRPYLLALQLKGILCFADSFTLLDFLRHWERDRPLLRYGLEERRGHPFGLIEQVLGLLHARAWRETGQRGLAAAAREAFSRAAQHMNPGGPLLRALAHFAEVRRELFALEAAPSDEASRDLLGRSYLALRGHLADAFGAAAWSEDEEGRSGGYFGGRDPGVGTPLAERARRVVAGVRFNYW